MRGSDTGYIVGGTSNEHIEMKYISFTSDPGKRRSGGAKAQRCIRADSPRLTPNNTGGHTWAAGGRDSKGMDADSPWPLPACGGCHVCSSATWINLLELTAVIGRGRHAGSRSNYPAIGETASRRGVCCNLWISEAQYLMTSIVKD